MHSLEDSDGLVIVHLMDFNGANHMMDQLLNNLLTSKLNNYSEEKGKKFSLDFELFVGWIGIECMDLVFSDQYDCFIVNDMKYLKSCKRIDHNVVSQMYDVLETFNQVQYEIEFQSMKLLTERGEEFIYANYRTMDDSNDGIVKIRVSDLMKGKRTLIWEWKVDVDGVSGFDVFKNNVYIISKSEMVVLDTKNGQPIRNVVVPIINDSCRSVSVISQNRMILASDSELQLWERNDQVWSLACKLDISIDYLHFYEETSNLIYVSHKCAISVIKLFDNGVLQLVTTFIDPQFYNNGMKVDRRTGFLYTCSAFNSSIVVRLSGIIPSNKVTVKC